MNAKKVHFFIVFRYDFVDFKIICECDDDDDVLMMSALVSSKIGMGLKICTDRLAIQFKNKFVQIKKSSLGILCMNNNHKRPNDINC